MINIAFCDDDNSILNEISGLLTKYCAQSEKEIRYRFFHSPLELMAEVEKGTRFDVLFLDILMPGQFGIDAAMEIRKTDENVKIIFLTSSAEYAVQSYSVGAYYYQMKPIEEETFLKLLDSVLGTCENEHEKSLILRCKNGITRVDLRQLMYCEVMHRTVFLHLDHGKVYESVGTLDELHREVASYDCFIRPHRSYLVHLGYISSINYRGIVMSDNTEIPIPRGKYHEIKDAFLEYAFRNGQVIL